MSLVRSTIRIASRRSLFAAKTAVNNTTTIFKSHRPHKATNPLVGQLIQANMYSTSKTSTAIETKEQKVRTPHVILTPTGKTNEEKLQSIKEVIRNADPDRERSAPVDAFIWRILRDWKLIIELDLETYNLMLQFFSVKGNRPAVRQIFDTVSHYIILYIN